MAKWDHADLLSVGSKAVLYPEYCTLEELRQYNPGYLKTNEGQNRIRLAAKHWLWEIYDEARGVGDE